MKQRYFERDNNSGSTNQTWITDLGDKVRLTGSFAFDEDETMHPSAEIPKEDYQEGIECMLKGEKSATFLFDYGYLKLKQREEKGKTIVTVDAKSDSTGTMSLDNFLQSYEMPVFKEVFAGVLYQK